MALKIGTVLGRYAKLAPPDLLIRQFLSAALEKELRIKVSVAKISLQRGVLVVAASPLVKNEIAFQKEELLALLAQEFKEKSPRDIR